MKVTIIIPNYNGCHFMKPCLASLKEQTFQDYRILVVDNASTDGSVQYVREHYPEIEVIALDQNYGFSKAVNMGIRHSRTPYVILLNNDTTADPNYIEEMVKSIERSPRIFSVSSKMIQMYHPELIDSAGDLYTLTGWGVCRGVGRPVSNYTVNDEVFSACAGKFLRKSDYLTRIILLIWRTLTSGIEPKFSGIEICTVLRHWSTTSEAGQADRNTIPSKSNCLHGIMCI